MSAGLNYAACLPDSHTGVKELVIFTHSSPGNYTRDSCNAQCYQKAQRYGGLGAQRECLCSTNSEPNLISESQCSAACADAQVMKECGWTVTLDVFLVAFSASFRRPLRFSVHREAALTLRASVHPAGLSWDFGDGTAGENASAPWPNRTEHVARHKYALPGEYPARVTLWSERKEVSVPRKEITVPAKVRVTLPPKLELACPATVVANQSIHVGLVNWGGEGVAVGWKVLLDGNEVARGELLIRALP